jgi:hypothetical protein
VTAVATVIPVSSAGHLGSSRPDRRRDRPFQDAVMAPTLVPSTAAVSENRQATPRRIGTARQHTAGEPADMLEISVNTILDPSRVAELTFGIESKQYAGLSNNRWLVAMQGDWITLGHKPYPVHGDWRYHLPKRIAHSLTTEEVSLACCGKTRSPSGSL